MSRKSRKNVGVIGLGIIGSRVAAGLRGAGYQVYVWNRTAKPMPNFLGSPAEVAESNRRYHSPLQSEAELARYIALVGGHPYLVRRGLHAMASGGWDIGAFVAQSEQEDGLFADYLRRMRLSLQQDPGLCEALQAVLRGQPCPSNEDFFRLQSAGILVGHSVTEARLRCGLYQTYLEKHLP